MRLLFLPSGWESKLDLSEPLIPCRLDCDPEGRGFQGSHEASPFLISENMAAYKVVHAVCLAFCETQIMDTRHITLNEWQLLPEARVLAVAWRVAFATSIPVQKKAGQGASLRRTLTVVRPVMVHLRVCRLSMRISPAKGEKSLDLLHSTAGGGGGGEDMKDSVTWQAVLQETASTLLLAPRPRVALSPPWMSSHFPNSCFYFLFVFVFLKEKK